jgi:inorganic pyrophosphatase
MQHRPIRVFIQNEAHSTTKNYHNEKTLVYRESRAVSHPYPFPYGLVIDTESADGCNVDCYVITDRSLRIGEILECEPLALMEQFEDGVTDHNVLVRPLGEVGEVSVAIQQALTVHVLTCFRHVPEKRISVGRFLDARNAENYLASHRAGTK